MKKYKLGFLGLGKMGNVIAKGAVKSGIVKKEEICVYKHSENTKRKCKEEGFILLETEREVADNSQILILATTPQVSDGVLEKIRGCNIDCMLSIVTGFTIEHIRRISGEIPIVRGMPNTPLRINEGSIALCKSDDVKEEDYNFLFNLFNGMGVTEDIDESQMEDIIIVSGSTPAYFFYMAEVMVKDAVKRGINEKTARSLIAETMIGSGKLLQSDPCKPLENFTDEVCSKGGTTIEAISAFKEDNRLKRLVEDANDRCLKRAEELGKED